MSNYADQAGIESVLNRKLTESEVAGLPLLLNAVDAFINREAGRSFGIGDEPTTRYYDAEDSKYIDIDPVYVDETHGMIVASVDADENVLDTISVSNYEARPRNEAVKTYLQLRSGRWKRGNGVANIAVTGFFGGGATPDDIKYLAAFMAAQYIGASKSAMLKSENIEGYSRTFATIQTDYPIVNQTLGGYKEVLI